MSKISIVLQGKSLEHHAANYIEYIRNEKARSSNTVAAYTQDLDRFLCFLTSDSNCITELSTACVTSFLKFLRYDIQLKPATVRRRLLTIQGFCQWLGVRGILMTNPFDDLALDLRVPKRLPRPVDSLTIRQLLLGSISEAESIGLNLPNSSRASQRSTTLLVIKLMLTTGVRVGEVSSIRIKDISSDGKSFHIFGKGNKERLVYVENLQLAESLSRYQSDRTSSNTSDSLFVNGRGNPLTPQTIRKRVKSMCKDIGTADSPTPHRFRHSAATLLIENGADIRVVQRLLGHASISTTELYTQVSDISLREVLRKADVLRQFQ